MKQITTRLTGAIGIRRVITTELAGVLWIQQAMPT
jgi:hypothetical protein